MDVFSDKHMLIYIGGQGVGKNEGTLDCIEGSDWRRGGDRDGKDIRM